MSFCADINVTRCIRSAFAMYRYPTVISMIMLLIFTFTYNLFIKWFIIKCKARLRIRDFPYYLYEICVILLR